MCAVAFAIAWVYRWHASLAAAAITAPAAAAAALAAAAAATAAAAAAVATANTIHHDTHTHSVGPQTSLIEAQTNPGCPSADPDKHRMS